MKNLKVSVIIPTLNEEHYIGHLLSCLENQTVQPNEIFVIDAGSHDKTVQIAKEFPQVKLIHSHPLVGHQRTLGGKKAKGDVLFFLDADVLPHPTFIEEIIAQFHKRKLDIACPRFQPFPSNFLISFVYYFFFIIFWICQFFLASGGGSCIIVRKKVFEDMNGFNETLTYEDIEFIRRSSRKYKFRLLPIALKVSDRRFRKYGVLPMFFQYTVLSIFFTFGLFKQANAVPYVFGKYKH